MKLIWSKYVAETGSILSKLDLIIVRRPEFKGRCHSIAGFALLCLCLISPALGGKAHTKAGYAKEKDDKCWNDVICCDRAMTCGSYKARAAAAV